MKWIILATMNMDDNLKPRMAACLNDNIDRNRKRHGKCPLFYVNNDLTRNAAVYYGVCDSGAGTCGDRLIP